MKAITASAMSKLRNASLLENRSFTLVTIARRMIKKTLITETRGVTIAI